MVANDRRPNGRVAWLAFLTLALVLLLACGASSGLTVKQPNGTQGRDTKRHDTTSDGNLPWRRLYAGARCTWCPVVCRTERGCHACHQRYQERHTFCPG